MQRNDTPESGKNQNHAPRFLPVLDSRKRKVRGLWKRGSRFYAQIRMEVGDGQTKPKRIPLGEEVVRLDQAVRELERVRTENRAGKLPLPKHQPTFAEFADHYLASPTHSNKRLNTQKAERLNLGYWKTHLGGVRVGKIPPVMIHAYREKRLKEGVKARTINIELIHLYAVLKYAVQCGVIDGFKRVSELPEKAPPKRRLLEPADIEAFFKHCTPEVTKNADLLRFYLRFLALTGAREKESLRVRWADIDTKRRLLTIGSDAETKSGRSRTVNFTRELADLFAEMEATRPPDSSFLFPSPQRGSQDIPARSLRESFRLARQSAKLPWLGFHDFRHFFASQCVMAGLDFMTIASWLGHQDGGVLVGKVYGHLADAHKAQMADRLSILKPPVNVISLPAQQC